MKITLLYTLFAFLTITGAKASELINVEFIHIHSCYVNGVANYPKTDPFMIKSDCIQGFMGAKRRFREACMLDNQPSRKCVDYWYNRMTELATKSCALILKNVNAAEKGSDVRKLGFPKQCVRFINKRVRRK